MPKSFKIKVGDVSIKVKNGGLTQFEQQILKAFAFNLMSIISAPDEILRGELGIKLGEHILDMVKEIKNTAEKTKID